MVLDLGKSTEEVISFISVREVLYACQVLMAYNPKSLLNYFLGIFLSELQPL